MDKKSDLYRFLKTLLIIILVGVFLGVIAQDCDNNKDQESPIIDRKSAPKSKSEKYPAPWIETLNSRITKALAKNRIHGCGQYKYRQNTEHNKIYLVRCTGDGLGWSSYIVMIETDEVMGPYPIDPSLN